MAAFFLVFHIFVSPPYYPDYPVSAGAKHMIKIWIGCLGVWGFALLKDIFLSE
jgi:hypothetical protein